MLSRWHVLWVTERYPPLSGGMAESAGRQVRGLRKRGHVLRVVHFARAEGPIVLERRDRDNGQDLRVRCLEPNGNAVQRAWHEVEKASRYRPFDVVVGFGCGLAGHVATTWAAFLRTSSVVLVRGNDFDRDWFDPRRHGLVASALHRATVVGAVTREKAEKIRALFPDSITYWTPNGVDVDRWRLLPGEEAERDAYRRDLAAGNRAIFGVFGELKYKKRVPFWLEAIRDAGLADGLALLVVGRMDRELHELFQDPVLAPISSHVSFRSPDQLPPLYHACDFLILPSLFEGFPNVLLEAMACGVIPVCSRAGAMGEVLVDGETALLFEAEDRAGAAAATRRALELTPADRAAMKARIQALVRDRFSRDNEIDAIEAVLQTAREVRAHGQERTTESRSPGVLESWEDPRPETTQGMVPHPRGTGSL